MINFRSILYPTDLSAAARPALRYAHAFAKWYGARLRVLHVTPTLFDIPVHSDWLGTVAPPPPPPSRAQLIDLLRTTVGDTLMDIDCELTIDIGDPARIILAQANAISADLIVMGTHGRSGFDRLMHGSVAEKALVRATCPVLVVPPATADGATPVFRRILCPTDFSASAETALRYALSLRLQSGGQVEVLHVVEWLAEEEPQSNVHFNASEFRRVMLDDASQRLSRLVAGIPEAASGVTTTVAAGHAHRRILEHAAAMGADLIVMGAQGRGGVGLALFGSVTQKVLRGGSLPVLVTR